MSAECRRWLRPERSSVALVNDVAANHREKYTNVLQATRLQGERVVAEDNQIGELAGFQTALQRPLASRLGIVGGVGPLVPRQFFSAADRERSILPYSDSLRPWLLWVAGPQPITGQNEGG